MKLYVSVDHVLYEREVAKYAEEAFLRQRGWERTSLGGGLQVWRKSINGDDVNAVTRDTALHIEENVEAHMCRCPGTVESTERDIDRCPLHGGWS